LHGGLRVSAGRNNYELHGISYKPHAQFDGTSLASFGDTSESLSLSLTLTFMFFLENVYDPYITNNGCTHDVGIPQWQSKPLINSLTNIHISVLLMLGWKRQEEQGPCNFQMILTTSQT
jgi:hypothetical protein